MSAWSSEQSAIIEVLSSVEGIGRVLDRPVDLRAPADFRQTAMVQLPDGRLMVNVWFVELTSISTVRGPSAGMRVPLGKLQMTGSFRITGLYSYHSGGASYFDFLDLVERILLALSQHISLGSPESLVTSPPEARVIDIREFGDILCHFCEIHLDVQQVQNMSFE